MATVGPLIAIRLQASTPLPVIPSRPYQRLSWAELARAAGYAKASP